MIVKTQTQELYEYCEQHSTTHDELLADLYRETYQKVLKPRMASGPLQGRVLAFISKLKQPNHILEIGTFTGYATLCLAEGLQPAGTITTVEVNPELSFLSNKYFKKSKWSSQIIPCIGDAKLLLQKYDKQVDLVFIDAKKQDYQKYYDLIIDQVPPGGIILADNILWDGKVLKDHSDKTTEAIKAFNAYVLADARVTNVILPLRDGVNVIVKC